MEPSGNLTGFLLALLALSEGGYPVKHKKTIKKRRANPEAVAKKKVQKQARKKQR